MRIRIRGSHHDPVLKKRPAPVRLTPRIAHWLRKESKREGLSQGRFLQELLARLFDEAGYEVPWATGKS